MRTRTRSTSPPVDPHAFWAGPWVDALAANGEAAAADADLLGVEPLTLRIEGRVVTLRRGDTGLEVVPGAVGEQVVGLDRDAFEDLVTEERTALGLAIAGRAEGTPAAHQLFCAWDPVLRSALDGRSLYRPGQLTLRDRADAPLDLDRHFRLGEEVEEAAHFLAEAGFLLLEGVFTEAELEAIDADLAWAVEAARPDDGTSWWATTASDERYPCRILDLVERSLTLRRLLGDPRFLAISGLLDDGHRPGDPFGERFADLTAEGLVKRVDSVDGLSCLPWHKDCERGGHSTSCSGLTVGICLTPVDADHGGLDVLAGSHRVHLARQQVDRGVDLPVATLRAERGDVTVHLSCALHRSTHPQRRERRVVYTGFALPPRPGEPTGDPGDQAALRAQRAAIARR